ncbi:MAG: hypothetical protein JXA82_11205 [Sedimentisphaerales bacterium]|nr:hypothetical protein [Sedimentisphaerales bacterium]
MTKISFIISVALVLFLLQPCQGEVLWSSSQQDKVGSETNPVTGVFSFALFYSEQYHIPDPIPETLVNWEDVNAAENIGNTILRDDNNDPEFNGFLQYLTNGQDDHFRKLNANYVEGEYESNYFPFTYNGIDFQGYSIDSVGLTIDSFTFVGGYVYQVDYTYTINGYIPEPATIFTFCLGALLVHRIKKSPCKH